MAQATGATSSYDMTINREDLSNILHMISPEETPFLSAIGTTKATSTNHEWGKKALAAAAANAQIEGDDASPGNQTQATRVGNRTQILTKTAVVTGTQQDGMVAAGISDKMAEEVADRMKEIKLDLEYAMIGVHNAKVTGNDTTAREMGSFQTYLTTNTSAGATGTDPTGDGSDAPGAGTARAFTETLLTSVLQSCFDEGSKVKLMYVDAVNKGLVSGFDGGGTHYVDKDNKELVNSVDVYVGDFHTLKAVPSRQLKVEDVLLVDPEYVKRATLRSIHSYDLAKDGDSYRKQIIMEETLEVCNEAAHGIIRDTHG